MKRKVRLFSAIMALCLSIGLLAFGVYAASTITYNISGTVNYTMTDVLVNVTTSLAYVKDNTTTTDTKENKIGYTDATVKTATFDGTDLDGLTTKLTGDTTITTYDSGNIANDVTTGTANLSISFNDSTAWKVSIAISTIQKDVGVNIALGNFGVGEGANYNVVADTNNKATIEKEGNTTLVYYVYLIDPTVAISNKTFTIPLTLTQAV